jgi:hypothetical protein
MLRTLARTSVLGLMLVAGGASSAVALLFATLRSSPAAAEDDCPKGDLPVTGTVEGRATTAGFIVNWTRRAVLGRNGVYAR